MMCNEDERVECMAVRIASSSRGSRRKSSRATGSRPAHRLHQGRGCLQFAPSCARPISTRWRSPCESTRHGAIRTGAALRIRRRNAVAPAAEPPGVEGPTPVVDLGIAAGKHDVAGRLVGLDPVPQARELTSPTDCADLRASPWCRSVSDPKCGSSPRVGIRYPVTCAEQRGLARTVCTQKDPVLSALHAPADVLDDHGLALDAKMRDFERRGAGASSLDAHSQGAAVAGEVRYSRRARLGPFPAYWTRGCRWHPASKSSGPLTTLRFSSLLAMAGVTSASSLDLLVPPRS